MPEQKGPAKSGRKGLKDGLRKGIPKETDVLCELLVDSMRDITDLLGIPLDRDIQTVQERYKKEGFGFISKTLPLFLDWLRSCLADERLRPCNVFKNHYVKQGGRKVPAPYPAFLRGLVMVLANEDGSLKYATTPEQRDLQRAVLQSIGMICTGFGKKYEIPLPSDVLDKQVINWFRDDQRVFDASVNEPPEANSLAGRALSIARQLIHTVFQDYAASGVKSSDYGRYYYTFGKEMLRPHHGSGATSFALANYEKYTRLIGYPLRYGAPDGNTTIPALLEPEGKVWCPQTKGDSVRLLSWLEGGCSRVAIVPKNSTKGRIICMEPAENMLAQQGIRGAMYAWIQRHPLTRGFVNFTEQDVNGKLALEASKSGYRATLDLKAASDSVSLWLVRLLFPAIVRDLLESCRSPFARAKISTYKGGRKVGEMELRARLKKFAPMGSAVCFPVEALCFWALAKGTMIALGAEDTDVWVYGDDTILPAQYADDVSAVFSIYGLTINADKSFTTGHFRESCGVDAYDGMDITPGVRCSTRLPGYGKRRSSRTANMAALAKSVAAWVDYANSFEVLCYPRVSRRIRRTLRKLWPSSSSFPILSTPCKAGFLHFLDYERGIPVSQLGKDEYRVERPLGEYNFDPHFPKPDAGPWDTSQQHEKAAPVQGELFTREDRNYYCGRSFRGWLLENRPKVADITQSERYLRWNLERGKDMRSDVFVARENLRLARKRIVLG